MSNTQCEPSLLLVVPLWRMDNRLETMEQARACIFYTWYFTADSQETPGFAIDIRPIMTKRNELGSLPSKTLCSNILEILKFNQVIHCYTLQWCLVTSSLANTISITKGPTGHSSHRFRLQKSLCRNRAGLCAGSLKSSTVATSLNLIWMPSRDLC